MSEAWIGLIGVIAGVVISNAVTLIGTFTMQRAQRRERFDQQRVVIQDRKREAFFAFLLSSLRFYDHVVALDLAGLSGSQSYRGRLQILRASADPEVTDALDRSAVSVRLLTGGRLSKDVDDFTAKMVQDALTVALGQSPEFGGYNTLAATLTKKLEAELEFVPEERAKVGG